MATEIRDLVVDEISLVDAPANRGARVVLLKRDAAGDPAHSAIDALRPGEADRMLTEFIAERASEAAQEEAGMKELITKALAERDKDAPSERDRKRLVKAQLRAGTVSVERVAAELVLDAHAATIRKASPEMSAERAFVEAMNRYPDLAAIAVG